MPIASNEPSGSSIGDLIAVITVLIYVILISTVVIDVVTTIWRRKKRKPHALTYDDYQRVLDGEYIHITLPIWANISLGEFNVLASDYYKTTEKALEKHRAYAESLKSMPNDTEEYSQYVSNEYEIVETMVMLAEAVCTRFINNLEDRPLGFSECPHTVVQRYCAIVNRFREQRQIIENEFFIPPDLKEKYQNISNSLFDLFDLMNSNIQVF